jgi:phage-related tail protein
MAQDELKEALDTFSDGNGFGDPDARRNAEQRVQILAAMGQQEHEKSVLALAQEANDIARTANQVASRSVRWAMYAAIAAVIALIISVIGLQK